MINVDTLYVNLWGYFDCFQNVRSEKFNTIGGYLVDVYNVRDGQFIYELNELL